MNTSACQDYATHLTAFLHRELPSPDAERIEKHLSGCEGCRAEVDRLHGVTRHLRKQVLTEPSAKARKQLQQRMEQALKPAPKSPEPRRPQQQHPEGWHFVASEPQALTMSPSLPAATALPALPAPATPALANSFPARVTVNSPSVAYNTPATLARLDTEQSRISARMTAESARVTQRRERLGIFLCLILALVTALAGVAAWRLLNTSTKAKVLSQQELADLHEWQERVRARDLGGLKQVFLSKQVSLPFEASGTLLLLPRTSADSGAAHFVVYREEDVEKLLKDPGTDSAALAKELEKADKLTVIDGSVTLPARLKDGSDLGSYIGRAQRLSFLLFDRRVELWPSNRLQNYLEQEPAERLAKAGETRTPDAK